MDLRGKENLFAEGWNFVVEDKYGNIIVAQEMYLQGDYLCYDGLDGEGILGLLAENSIHLIEKKAGIIHE